jgi:hypothetical protein
MDTVPAASYQSTTTTHTQPASFPVSRNQHTTSDPTPASIANASLWPQPALPSVRLLVYPAHPSIYRPIRYQPFCCTGPPGTASGPERPPSHRRWSVLCRLLASGCLPFHARRLSRPDTLESEFSWLEYDYDAGRAVPVSVALGQLRPRQTRSAAC